MDLGSLESPVKMISTNVVKDDTVVNTTAKTNTVGMSVSAVKALKFRGMTQCDVSPNGAGLNVLPAKELAKTASVYVERVSLEGHARKTSTNAILDDTAANTSASTRGVALNVPVTKDTNRHSTITNDVSLSDAFLTVSLVKANVLTGSVSVMKASLVFLVTLTWMNVWKGDIDVNRCVSIRMVGIIAHVKRVMKFLPMTYIAVGPKHVNQTA